MDARTRLASLLALTVIGAAVAWTAGDEHARRELERVFGFGEPEPGDGRRRSASTQLDEPRPSVSRLELGPRAGLLESQPWSCPSCEVRLHVDPALSCGADAECEISYYGRQPEPRERVRLAIVVRADGRALVSAQAFDLCENDLFRLALPNPLAEGARLALSGEYFSDLGELIGAEAPDAPPDERLMPYDSLAGTLTLGSATLAPGSDVPLRFDLTSDSEDERPASRRFRITGLVRVEPARDEPQRAK